LLNLDESIQEALLNGKISERHARSLLNLKNVEDQKRILEKIITNKLTVKQTDNLINKINEKNIPLNNNEENKFITEDQKKILNNGAIDNINVEKIKEESVDINPKKELTNVNMLLNNEEQNLAFNKQEDNSEKNKVSNKFVPNLKYIENEEEILDIEQDLDSTIDEVNQELPNNTSSLIEEYHQAQIHPNFNEESEKKIPELKNAINMIRDLTDILEKKGFIINNEEFDFENLYQVIIKIKK